MNLFNATPYKAAYNLGLQKSGRNCLIIVVKATFNLPKKSDEEPLLAEDQVELFDTDTFTGDPGMSAPIYENDFATHKPKCDVLLHASAYSQKPVTEMQVGFKLNDIEKTMNIIGPRYLKKSISGNAATKPEPFTQQTISYDTAYGGAETKNLDDTGKYSSHEKNPVGVGFYPFRNSDELLGRSLPQSEEIGKPASSLNNTSYVPKAFGPIARNWEPRLKLGGTYDDHWSDNIRPFLPEDFDELFYQCAPPDQQTKYLRGGEQVLLSGLVPQGKIKFNLPKVDVPMQAILSNGERHNLNPVIDTLIIEPDEERFTMVWRSRIGIRKSAHEVDTLIAGKPTPAWERARMMDKLFLPLEELNAFKKRMQKRYDEEQRIRDLNDTDLAKEIKP